ncbi:hypothetical protein BDFB_008197 [Asbolus verrucosus]|uniref:Uncharacterized protein n=1 Tax=Asbolus verrucosus TaxID=1661398 RepID=A0A482VX59_ASBVE|nr:hypothetical protein BDFB_008197 [Asbolus verrucosus]
MPASDQILPEDVLVERGVQGGVPEPVPVQVPGVVLLQGSGQVLQRLLLDDGHRLHLDAARDQGRIAVEESQGQAQARRPCQNTQVTGPGLSDNRCSFVCIGPRIQQSSTNNLWVHAH